MGGYDCKIQYLKGKDYVCTDLLPRAVDESKYHDDPPVYINDSDYVISAINSNLFEPKYFASCKNAEDPMMTHKWPSL